MVKQSTVGTAQQVSLNRVAHVAGEAFAFIDPEPAIRQRPRMSGILVLWSTIAIAAAAVLWAGL